LMAAGFNAGFTDFAGGGYFLGGPKTLPGAVGAPILAQVRVWDTRFGATYEQARDSGGEFGFSNPFQVTPLVPLATPANLVGLQGFRLQAIPELSSVILAIFGTGIVFSRMWMRARRVASARSA